jgi:hypothetical protein
MLLRDLRQTHPGATVVNYLLSVYIEPRSPDLATFQLRPAHACLDALDDDAPLQFRHRGDDNDDCPAERSLGVNRFPLREELDAHPVQFVNRLEKMLRRTRQSVARPDQEHVEPVSAGVVHHPVKLRSPRPRSRDAVVDVLAGDFESLVGGELSKLAKLGLRVLVNRGDATIKCGSFHRHWSSLDVGGN